MIFEHTDGKLQEDFIYNNIDRAHRGSPKANTGSPPTIFVKFVSWKALEKVKTEIIKANKSSPNQSMHFSQMYSILTTDRRNQAFKRRLELRNSRTDLDFIITFPANILSRQKNTSKQIHII